MSRIKIPRTHKLKILPKYFQACVKGYKNFEIRKNDRDFKVGDKIELREFEGGKFTEKVIKGQITYITDYEQQDGYVVFAFKKFAVLDGRSWAG